MMIILISFCFGMKPMTAYAIPISTGSIPFDDHRGMTAKINGSYVYCVKRGYPFRSKVSDIQMVRGEANGHEGTLADITQYLYSLDISDVADGFDTFRGWGQWQINGDKTEAYQVGTNGAPSSDAWLEEFEEHTEDDEDEPYRQRYPGGIEVRKWFSEVGLQIRGGKITGHEGAIDVYPTTMKKISYSEAGYSMPQVYAQAILQYYCWEDPDTASYSETVKYQTRQALEWATQYGFITTTGGTGNRLIVIYKNSTGGYGRGAANTYSGSCDGYIKTTIGSNYEAMKLYRQVVWKTVNMRSIPSFAQKEPATCEPIKLYWDEEQRLYTTTVSDANGVLDYFDFSVSGCSVTNNGDGTLTISTPNQIGIITSAPSQSKLEPADGIFHLPDFFKWDKAGKDVTFTYSAMHPIRSTGGSDQYEEDGVGRKSLNSMYTYDHSHDYSPACNWFCKTPQNAITHCTHSYNSCDGEPNAGEEKDYDDEGNETGSHYTRHEHTTSCHTHTIECTHEYDCPYWIKSRGMGYAETYINAQPIADCERKWCCGKEHFEITEQTFTGKYIDWQPTAGVYATGQKLIDPEICYIKVETVPHVFPAETDTEILLIADHDEWNDLTYTAPNGKTIAHSSHLRVGEKYHLKYIYSYKGASKGFRIEFSVQNKPYYQ